MDPADRRWWIGSRIAVVAGLLLFLGGWAPANAEELVSPRLNALRKEMEVDGAAALERFWRQLAVAGTPLVEPVAGEGDERLVTFLWRGGDETHNVLVAGSPSNLASEEGIAEARLRRLPGTDVWYKSRRMRADARFTYAFSVNDSLVPGAKATEQEEEARWAALKPDPWNPRRAPEPLASLAELPAAPPQPWIVRRPNVPAGRVEEHRFRSERLGNERIVRIYTPPGYAPQGTPYGLLVVLDGRTYTSDVPTPTILDNLLAAGRIPPLVAVFVANPSPEARSRELSCHPPFAEFLGRELIPWVRRGHRVTADPARTAIAGSSLGGLAAACAAVQQAEVFGNVLSLSGSFYWRPPGETEPEGLARQLATGPKLPLRFYLEAGLMEDRPRPEGPSLLAANRHLRTVLQAKGYAVDYREFNGGHSILSWRGSLADGLLALFGREGSAAGRGPGGSAPAREVLSSGATPDDPCREYRDASCSSTAPLPPLSTRSSASSTCGRSGRSILTTSRPAPATRSSPSTS